MGTLRKVFNFEQKGVLIGCLFWDHSRPLTHGSFQLAGRVGVCCNGEPTTTAFVTFQL
jgi:hypothetical protein